MFQRFHRLLLLVVLLLGVVGLTPVAYAQETDLRNISFQERGKVIIVTYDLIGEAGEKYEVELYLSSDGGSTYDYQPQAVSGDVGDDVRIGTQKRIQWNVLKDFPGGIQGSNYRFRLTADKQGGNAIWYVLGTGLIGGAVGSAVMFLGGGGNDGGGNGGDPPPSTPTAIPAPPGPPGN